MTPKSHKTFSHIILFFLFLLVLPPCFSDPQNPKFLDCAPTPYTCAGIEFNASYPFRVGNRPDYCGYEGFLLQCSDDNSTLETYINSKTYKVKNIDFINSVLTIVDIGLVSNDSCLQSFSNTTMDFSRFAYTDRDRNVTIYFSCTASFPGIPSLYNFACPSGIPGQYSYYKLDNSYLTELLGKCSVALIPLNQSDADALANGQDADALSNALKGGFTVRWTVGGDWCSSCMSSGGFCGYNSSFPDDHTCFCANSTTLDSCSAPIDGSSSGFNIKLIVGLVVGFTSFVLLCIFFFLCFCRYRRFHSSITFWKKKSRNAQTIENFLKNYGSISPKRYNYFDIKKMTKSFSDKLGQGGFGTVFKGKLPNGHQVAVKVLSDSKGNGEEFVNEVASIGRTSHVNIVSLLGFCSEGSKRALIYDFMPNGSLEKFIYAENPKTTTPLGWEKLYEIAIGIARGLEYLHRGCNTRIVHFDIKPHNILLDQDFCPKISDFGLAMLSSPKVSIISMHCARGTIGYIAPEVFSRSFGVVSSKSDVYSYGMMVLEMVGGRKNVDAGVENTSAIYFPEWIYEHLNRDGVLVGACGVTSETEEIARKMVLVGLWCIQIMPGNRPSMSRVVEMLEGSIGDLQMPPKPCISSPSEPVITSYTKSTS